MRGVVWSFFLYIILPLNLQGMQEDFFSMSLEELLQVEVYSSTLTPESLKTVPSALTVFTQLEIDRMGLDTLGELMNLVPGFQSYRSSSSSLSAPFSSRGRRIGNVPAEILVMIDGHRLDSPQSSGSTTLAPNYPLRYIEKVEFIRGPGAAVYGSNAMMGVINITTRTNVNALTASYGSFNRRQIFIQTSEKFTDMTVDLFGRIDVDDGTRYNLPDTFSNNRIDTDDPRMIADLNLKLAWQNTRINIQHSQFETENFYELNTISNGFNAREGAFDSISLQHDFAWQKVESYLWLSYNFVSATLSSQITAPGALAGISNPASNDALFIKADFDDYAETRIQLHNDWEINTLNRLQFGIELRRLDAPEAIARNNFDLGDLASQNLPIRFYGGLLPTTPVQARSKRDIIGLYGQYQHQLTETTSLTLGLRYDDFSDIGSQVSPRLGIVQELNENHSLKLLYGEAFRAPSESELNLLNNPVLLGNSDLKPETVQNWDLIWIGQWSQTGLSLGYYESHFKDSIVQIELNNGTTQFQNKDQDPTQGIEFELSQELNSNWLLRASYSYIIDKPDLSFREADQSGSMSANYQYHKWNANLVATYTGEREFSTNGNSTTLITLDDYWLVYGKLQYNFTLALEVFLQAKNLLDENYTTPTASSSLNEGVPNRGRELLAGLSWKF